MDNITIRELTDSDLDEVSEIVTRNLLEINTKDYPMEEMIESATHFSKENIKKTLSYRKKVFVAVKSKEIVGTAGLEADWNKVKDTYSDRVKLQDSLLLLQLMEAPMDLVFLVKNRLKELGKRDNF